MNSTKNSVIYKHTLFIDSKLTDPPKVETELIYADEKFNHFVADGYCIGKGTLDKLDRNNSMYSLSPNKGATLTAAVERYCAILNREKRTDMRGYDKDRIKRIEKMLVYLRQYAEYGGTRDPYPYL